ncbi:PH domain-containing protein [Actinotalea solisilvae]|uniref:PH domain-containing protein n=1 Tax=Actinotalea solisilvae TaxID=2072922 RepID=UPI0027DE2E3F|nr:PH domain-containing protein [Actinotalea solisilvae]
MTAQDPLPAVPEADPAAAGPVGEPVWHRVHPVTPAVKGWKIIAVLLVILAQQVGPNLLDAGDLVRSVGWLPVVGVIALVAALGFGYAALAWRMTRYGVDAEAVYLKTGVLFRQHRTARLDRVQAIDVVQPVLARLLGLAELRFEVAGGSDSTVTLSFLREDAAQRLRNELLARSAGIEFGTEDQPEAPAAPEREVLAVPVGRLLGALLRSVTIVVLTLGIVGAVVATVASGEISVAFSLLPMVLGVGGYLWQRFAGEFNFRAAQSPDGIRLRHGLLESRSQTLPPGRVQAVRLSQAWLWRRKDWWRVEVNVAGYGKAENQQTENVLLPVGDRDDALLALWLVLPDLGVEDPRAVLDEALSGTGAAPGSVGSPRRARWLDPLAWRRTAVVSTERAVLVRSGRFVRRLVVVPHERTQSLGLTQGPLQRRLGLATVVLHSTPGPVRPFVPHLDAATAGALLGQQADRARRARAAAGPERWMRRVPA